MRRVRLSRIADPAYASPKVEPVLTVGNDPRFGEDSGMRGLPRPLSPTGRCSAPGGQPPHAVLPMIHGSSLARAILVVPTVQRFVRVPGVVLIPATA